MEVRWFVVAEAPEQYRQGYRHGRFDSRVTLLYLFLAGFFWGAVLTLLVSRLIEGK